MKRNTFFRGIAAILLIFAMAMGLNACGGSSSNSSGSSGLTGGISGSGN